METPDTSSKELLALQSIIKALEDQDPEARSRIFSAAATFLEIPSGNTPQVRRTSNLNEHFGNAEPYPSFSADNSMSPKEFMYQKQPNSDVERIASLAFYLTHYRDTPHFKTIDLSKLNTEAAQPRFSNATVSANNAIKAGYLISLNKGQRQLSAVGERFVNALPDREAARSVLAASRPRRKQKKAVSKSRVTLKAKLS
ncbi:MAG: hypothetical protein WA090_05175 [Candidatus Nanopelagicaceae bacterium]